MEYSKGSFPSAINMPLLNDQERHQVGIVYKDEGQEAAIALGNQLVCDATVKPDRMKQWIDFVQQQQRHQQQRNDDNFDTGSPKGSSTIDIDTHAIPQCYLYCFRGGLRSQTVQRWIQEETGIRVGLVLGGYKQMRQYLMQVLEQAMAVPTSSQSNISIINNNNKNHPRQRHIKFIRICGPTGSGKTRVLQRLMAQDTTITTTKTTTSPSHQPQERQAYQYCIDLELLAHHRGSAFGRWPEDPNQPSQIDFENAISIHVLKLLNRVDQEHQKKAHDSVTVFVEDEGKRIGKLGIPLVMRECMARADIVIIDEDIEHRIDMIIEDYVLDLRERYIHLCDADNGEQRGMQEHCDYIVNGLSRCQQRLGGREECEQLQNIVKEAFHQDLEQRLAAKVNSRHDNDRVISNHASPLHRIWIKHLLVDYYDPMYVYQQEQNNVENVLFRGTMNEVMEYCQSYGPICFEG